MIEVREYDEKYENGIKNLLIQLQKHLVEIDNEQIRLLTNKYEEYYFKYIFEIVNNNKGKIFVAIQNNAVVGLTIGYILEPTTDDKLRTKCPIIGKVSKLVVDKNLRQSGVGQILIDKIENYLKSIGCEYISIDVFGENKNAYNLYTKNGYTTRIHNMIKKIS